MQIHQFMEYPKSSCLDLQFIPLPVTKRTGNIQKTKIFINSIPKIHEVIRVIQSWIEKLGYLEESMK